MNQKKIIYLIIDNIEGGYYHPDMKAKLKNGERMLDSGETMYGIDRKAGAPGFTTGTQSAVEFWQIIDQVFGSHHSDTGYYGDKADGTKKVSADVGLRLKPLAADMIIKQFEKNIQFLSDGARRMVYANPRLMLQFLYATYNGSGNFQLFADVMNAAYANGERSAEAFWDLIQAKRRAKGGHFAEGADKLEGVAAQLDSNRKSLGWLLLGAVVGYFTVKSFKK